MSTSTSNPLVTLAKRLVGLPTRQSNCCTPSDLVPAEALIGADAEKIHDAVRARYSEIARTRDTSLETGCADACGCGDASVEQSLYPAAEAQALPTSVTELSLGCGDPVTLADIRVGDTVLDLGSGGGIDCFFAAKRVGPTGQVIGVDMTPAMLERARANAQKMNATNVEFRHGQIEAMPVDDATIDVVLSNCVINLAPDKGQVFGEMFRVLKPGGRVSVSDIVTNGKMSALMAQNLASWAGCIAGALPAQDYRAGLEAAGFVDVTIMPKSGDDLVGKVSPVLANIPAGLPFSALITARKV